MEAASSASASQSPQLSDSSSIPSRKRQTNSMPRAASSMLKFPSGHTPQTTEHHEMAADQGFHRECRHCIADASIQEPIEFFRVRCP
jgi:hypothetical protein